MASPWLWNRGRHNSLVELSSRCQLVSDCFSFAICLGKFRYLSVELRLRFLLHLFSFPKILRQRDHFVRQVLLRPAEKILYEDPETKQMFRKKFKIPDINSPGNSVCEQERFPIAKSSQFWHFAGVE